MPLLKTRQSYIRAWSGSEPTPCSVLQTFPAKMLTSTPSLTDTALSKHCSNVDVRVPLYVSFVTAPKSILSSYEKRGDNPFCIPQNDTLGTVYVHYCETIRHNNFRGRHGHISE